MDDRLHLFLLSLGVFLILRCCCAQHLLLLFTTTTWSSFSSVEHVGSIATAAANHAFSLMLGAEHPEGGGGGSGGSTLCKGEELAMVWRGAPPNMVAEGAAPQVPVTVPIP